MRTSFESTARSAISDYLDDCIKQLRDMEAISAHSDITSRLRKKIHYINKARFELLNAEVL